MSKWRLIIVRGVIGTFGDHNGFATRYTGENPYVMIPRMNVTLVGIIVHLILLIIDWTIPQRLVMVTNSA